MKTVYAAALSRLGLTQPIAAELHNVRLDTVKSWCAGRREVPDGAWDDLAELEAAIKLKVTHHDPHIAMMQQAVRRLAVAGAEDET